MILSPRFVPSLLRASLSCAEGVICGAVIASTFSVAGGVSPTLFSPTSVFADTCSTSSGATNSGTTGADHGYGSLNIHSAQSTISFDTTHLGAGDICGGTIFYWDGMTGAASGGYNCSGGLGFAQDGWVAFGDNASRGPTYQFFSEYYDGTSNTGCGDNTVYYPVTFGSSDTYRVNQISYPYVGCDPSQVQFWMDGRLIRSACVQWDRGSDIIVETERHGAQSHIGRIQYTNSKYCTDSVGSGCTPNTTFAWNTNDLFNESDGYSFIDPTGYNFATCDSRDFTYSTC